MKSNQVQLDSRHEHRHTFGMKIAVSIPDDIFEEGEALVRSLKLSRSRIYARALREFVSRHNPDTLTEAYDKALAEADDDDSGLAKEAARRIFAKTEW
jgi:metal-responsive CopG/Arc/MetJ family transcriptional regulator